MNREIFFFCPLVSFSTPSSGCLCFFVYSRTSLGKLVYVSIHTSLVLLKKHTHKDGNSGSDKVLAMICNEFAFGMSFLNRCRCALHQNLDSCQLGVWISCCRDAYRIALSIGCSSIEERIISPLWSVEGM